MCAPIIRAAGDNGEARAVNAPDRQRLIHLNRVVGSIGYQHHSPRERRGIHCILDARCRGGPGRVWRDWVGAASRDIMDFLHDMDGHGRPDPFRVALVDGP